MRKFHALSMALFMTAPTTAEAAAINDPELDPGAGAGEISPTEAVSLPDTTEGNRGPSRTANSSGNDGDPTKVLHGDAGEIINSVDESPIIANSTNAFSQMAYDRLSPMTEVEVKLNRTVEKIYDAKPVFTELLGTDNVKEGPFNSAFRSIVFKYPEAHGQRACLVYRDGRCRLLASGSTYGDWYGQAQDPEVAMAAIVYFDQRLSAQNPYVSIRWYKKAELPEMRVAVDDSL